MTTLARMLNNLFSYFIICSLLIACGDSKVATKEEIDYETPIRTALNRACQYKGEQPYVFDMHQFGESKECFVISSSVSSRDYINTTFTDISDNRVIQKIKLRIDDYTSYDCSVQYEFHESELAKIHLFITDQSNENNVMSDILNVFDEIYGRGLKYYDDNGEVMYFYFFCNVFARVYVPNDCDCVVEYLDAQSSMAHIRMQLEGKFYPFGFTYSRTMRDHLGSWQFK